MGEIATISCKINHDFYGRFNGTPCIAKHVDESKEPASVSEHPNMTRVVNLLRNALSEKDTRL